MTLGNLELAALDRLLDEVLSLPPAERSRWLDELGEPDARYAPTLRDLLTRDAHLATAQLLGIPPRLDKLVAGEGVTVGELSSGQSIGPYRLLRELGEGGMGVVWLAERTDGLIKRPVALKLPLLFSLHHRGLADRFARERAILSTLAHPNIARLYDAGVTQTGQPFLALEYVEGAPLTGWCDARRTGLAERIALFMQVLRAVQYAHANLVIHRDLKPSNILVTADGEVRLLDFGIAKLATGGETQETELTRIAGRAMTMAYAAPEVVSGTSVSIASDVYSLGVILCELLCGARPYRLVDDSRAALETAILRDDAIPPSVHANDARAAERGLSNARKLAAALAGDLDTIALKALKKQPEERYATVAALAADIERHLRGDAIEARADHSLYRAAKLVRKHRLAFGAAAVIAIALIAGASVALWQAGEARQEAARANAVQQFVLDLFRANTVNQPDPVRARQTTVRELLDRGSERLARGLAEQPAARLQLLETMVGLYDELGMFPQAAGLSMQRVELAKSVYGDDDPRVAEALALRAYFLHAGDKPPFDEIDKTFAEAEAILDRRNDRTSLTRARLHYFAAMHYAERSIAKGASHGERSVAVYREHHPGHRELSRALSALGQARMRQGDRNAALAAWTEALDVTRKQHLPDYMLVHPLNRAGEVNAFLDRVDEADALLREGLTISERVNGAEHAATHSVRRALARHLAWTSRYDEALQHAARLVGDRSLESPAPWGVQENRRVLFEIHWGHGNLRGAREVIDAAFADPHVAKGDTFLHADLLINRAAVETAEGRFAEAGASLAHSARIAQRLQLPRASLLRSNHAMREAQLWLAQGDAAAAKRALEEQQGYWPPTVPGLATARVELAAGFVTALLATGDLEQAQSTALAAAAAFESEPARMHWVEAQAQIELMLGRVLTAKGDHGAALPHFERAASAYRRVQVAESPRRTAAEIALATCLLRLGRRDDALPLLARAREAQSAHAALGEQFLAPARAAEALARHAAAGSSFPASLRRAE
ncbi:MAG TPA: serine/threonine-protein kinase [Casimicrobiaceae bacterium]|nr:serine/threonine-protein kinase [Casimicrobiaceae bacterium]